MATRIIEKKGNKNLQVSRLSSAERKASNRKSAKYAPFVMKFDKAAKCYTFDGVKDRFNIIAVAGMEQMRQKILKKEYTQASFNLGLFTRLLKICESIEGTGYNLGQQTFEIYFPTTRSLPLVLHPLGSSNYYMLAPRVWDNIKKSLP